MKVQIAAPGTMANCKVCDHEHWAFIPCTLEVLLICLYCGNTIRERRAE